MSFFQFSFVYELVQIKVRCDFKNNKLFCFPTHKLSTQDAQEKMF